MTATARRESTGFTLVEVVIAMVLLAFGVLAIAAFAGAMNTQVRMGGERGERIAAMQQQLEILLSMPVSGITPVPRGSAATIGRYKVWYTATRLNVSETRVTLYSEGSAHVAGQGWVPVTDSLTFTVSQ